MNVLDFKKKKDQDQKISMVTCYDYWSAKIIEKTLVDTVLVGDSVAMVVHGYPTTINATVEMMSTHVKAVSRGIKSKFIVGDLPFLSYSKGEIKAMEAVETLMKAGAHGVKLEGVIGHEKVISKIVNAGVPVMGHVGLTPQSIHSLGGFKVQGKNDRTQELMMTQAKMLEDLGCFSLVLECIPHELATNISQNLSIPTIGIGAGPNTDGQVLVLQDLLGMDEKFNPTFLRKFLNGEINFINALNEYHQSVVEVSYPTVEESY